MSSNKGVYGPDSLRLNGKKVDELPIAEARQVIDQLPMVNAMDRMNQIEDIKAKYPKQEVAWIDGAYRECNGNMHAVRDLAARTQQQIDEYMGHIALCKHRDKLIGQANGDKIKLKEINAQFPPYNVKAMKQQIAQFRQTINRCNDVVDQEQTTMEELKTLRSKCVERDEKLKSLGGLEQ